MNQLPGTLLVVPHNAGGTLQITQILFSLATGAMFRRFRRTDTTWSAWSQNWDSEQLPQQSGSWMPRLIGAATAGNLQYTQRTGQWMRQGDFINVTFTVGTRSNLLGGAVGEVRMVDFPFDISNFLIAGSCIADGFRFPSWVTAIHGTPRSGVGQNFINFRLSGFGTSHPFNPATVILNTSNMTADPNTTECLLEGAFTVSLINA
jgi:hypothetical protein